MHDRTTDRWQRIGVPNASDPALEEEQVALIITWFSERGHDLDVHMGRDGSHHAAYPVTPNVHYFGIGESRLEAAQQAQAMFTAHERRDELANAMADHRPSL